MEIIFFNRFQLKSWVGHILISALLLLTITGYSQVYRASDTYANGQRKFSGKFVICTTHDERFPFTTIYEKRKFGKWIAYNSNGTVKEIRDYTKKGKNCASEILKQGEWKYFNKDGLLYLTEHYNNDILSSSEIEIYEQNTYLGKIIKTSFNPDTLVYLKNETTKNLIKNPSFDQYFYKPITIINDGKIKPKI